MLSIQFEQLALLQQQAHLTGFSHGNFFAVPKDCVPKGCAGKDNQGAGWGYWSPEHTAPVFPWLRRVWGDFGFETKIGTNLESSVPATQTTMPNVSLHSTNINASPFNTIRVLRHLPLLMKSEETGGYAGHVFPIRQKAQVELLLGKDPRLLSVLTPPLSHLPLLQM